MKVKWKTTVPAGIGLCSVREGGFLFHFFFSFFSFFSPAPFRCCGVVLLFSAGK
jgi:hypothetical protein